MRTESVVRFAGKIDRALRDEAGVPAAPVLVEAMRELAAIGSLLDDEEMIPAEDGYARHILYADPERRFTLLSLVWLPGQFTPVHGHTAWGVVGVYAGTPTEARFSKKDDGAVQKTAYLCRPGDVTTTSVGTTEMHRIINASADKVVTLHCYGLDLLDNPCAINIVYAQ